MMPLILIIAAAVLCLALAGLVRSETMAAKRRRALAGRAGEEKVGAMLDQAGGWDRLDDVVFGRSLRRSAQIDHLVRCPRRLVVIETKNWSGVLSGGASDRFWTLRRRTGEEAQLRNPLRQARRQARIVEDMADGDVEVRYLVVMAGRARHESGAFPEGVVTPRSLSAALAPLLEDPDEDPEDARGRVAAAWERLVENAYAPDAGIRAARYVAWLEARFGPKPWHAWLIAALAVSTVVYAMGLRVWLDAVAGGGT